MENPNFEALNFMCDRCMALHFYSGSKCPWKEFRHSYCPEYNKLMRFCYGLNDDE